VLPRARRSASLRTRLPVERILEAVAPLARGEDPDKGRFLAHGWFVQGVLGESDFQLEFALNNPRNRQNYVVTGVVSDEPPGWRVVELRMLSKEPWLPPVAAAIVVAFLGYQLLTGQIGAVGVLGFAGAAVLIFAFANLMAAPAQAIELAARALAGRIHGSYWTGREWRVP